MGERGEYRVFVGGLGWNTSQRHLQDAFSPFGKLLDCLVMVDRQTGRPRGFGFLTFADRRAMEDAIRGMDGRELDGRVISVDRAQARLGPENPYDAYGGGDRRSGGRESFRGGERLMDRTDECFKCGRMGHWAKDCPSSGGAGRYASQPEFRRSSLQGDRDYDRYYDRPGRGRYDVRDRLDTRDRYPSRERYSNERYPPIGDRFGGDRYVDRYPSSGYDRVRDYEMDMPIRGGGGGGDGGGRYSGGGPARRDKGGYRDRAHPYDAPRRIGRR